MKAFQELALLCPRGLDFQSTCQRSPAFPLLRRSASHCDRVLASLKVITGQSSGERKYKVAFGRFRQEVVCIATELSLMLGTPREVSVTVAIEGWRIWNRHRVGGHGWSAGAPQQDKILMCGFGSVAFSQGLVLVGNFSSQGRFCFIDMTLEVDVRSHVDAKETVQPVRILSVLILQLFK